MAGFGAFGKMPALGDFFRIGLAPGFTDPWDAWLQSGLLALGSALGPDWQALYLSAPIWRFTLSAGVAGPQAAQGVLMPSVDRVGRQFPLTLAQLLPGTPEARQTHDAASGSFETLEDIALDTLDGMGRDVLAQRLASLALPSAVTGPPSRRTVWSAVLPDGLRHLETEGLPGLSQLHALYDPDAPFWQMPAAEEARP